MAGILIGGADLAMSIADVANLIKGAANRTVMIINEDDHPIQFEFCQKNDSRGKYMIGPGQCLRVDFIPHARTCWWCNAWFNGLDQSPFPFNVWNGHGSSKRYIVRKDDGIYKAEINGSGEHVHVKF